MIERGSEWNRWDLHVHTASSYDYQYRGEDADDRKSIEVIAQLYGILFVLTPNSITCLRSYWYLCLVHCQRYCNNHQQNPPLLRSEGPVSHIHFRKAPKRYSKDYTATIHSVENIISSIKEGEIAIPEIQRPFVWDGSKVRDLMDSLYKGFPVGYIIVWKNPDIRLKKRKSVIRKENSD